MVVSPPGAGCTKVRLVNLEIKKILIQNKNLISQENSVILRININLRIRQSTLGGTLFNPDIFPILDSSNLDD